MSCLQPISTVGAVSGGTGQKRTIGQPLSLSPLVLCASFFSRQILYTDAFTYFFFFFKVEPKCVQTFLSHSALSVLLILLCLVTVKNQRLAFPTAR